MQTAFKFHVPVPEVLRVVLVPEVFLLFLRASSFCLS